MEEKVIDRIRKLYAHAESARGIGNEAEALAFMAKVDELLTAHKLARSVIEQDVDEDAVGIENLVALDGDVKSRRVGWVEQLAHAVALAYFCKVVVITGSNTIMLIGRESDREIAAYVIHKLIGFAKAEEHRQYRAAYFKKGFRASFRTAFVMRVRARLAELRRAHHNDPVTGSRYALVRQSSQAELDAFTRSKMETAAGRPTKATYSNSEGVAAGRAAGDRADLGARAVSGSGGPRLIGR